MTPESGGKLKGWLGTLMPLLREGGPVSLLLVIVLGGMAIYGLVGEIRRVHEVNKSLWMQLLEAQRVQVEMASRCGGEGKR